MFINKNFYSFFHTQGIIEKLETKNKSLLKVHIIDKTNISLHCKSLVSAVYNKTAFICNKTAFIYNKTAVETTEKESEKKLSVTGEIMFILL